MVAVAARHVVAVETHRLAALVEGDIGAVALEVVGLDVVGLVDRGTAVGLAGRHQVAGHLGLAVDHHLLAAGQPGQVDAHPAVVEGQLDALVGQALGVHALVHAGLAQQVDHALLQHAGADATHHNRCGC